MVREILSIQLGQVSNEIFAPCWNSFKALNVRDQSLIDPSIFNRTNHLEEYQPRLVCVNYKSRLNSEPTSKLVSQTTENVTEISSSEILKLMKPSSATEVTSDAEKLLISSLSQRSLCPVESYNSKKQILKFSGLEDFNVDNILDSCRYYAEECDSMQGLNMSFDSSQEIAGLTLKLVEKLKDEQGLNILMSFPLSFIANLNDLPKKYSDLQRANHSLSLLTTSCYSSLVLPFHLQKPSFQTANLAIETILTQLCFKSRSANDHFIQSRIINPLCGNNSKTNIAATSISINEEITRFNPVSTKPIVAENYENCFSNSVFFSRGEVRNKDQTLNFPLPIARGEDKFNTTVDVSVSSNLTGNYLVSEFEIFKKNQKLLGMSAGLESEEIVEKLEEFHSLLSAYNLKSVCDQNDSESE